ncbi:MULTISPECIES: DUF1491 family protein [Acetobacter]|uniref:DUF1491 family protein n=1 Tax=Acetobacter thailandicus TaxID=1502842 RepID=A0ABT3QES5_9PROT|nr:MULTISPECIES: DUF1491 family protein [Acetobacter]MBS0959936.1 DUF1491 family protein [Acetobacter thailandicus]MBS0979265.1 DUF1491 family protein [Acetobacter thailandicus]MBS1002383.1 DUF1491 family protein [Acetobacter thailandicus]MCX2563793.1 DUF1491 family protein [Acetobacter thailandicus]NHN95131.1 DUF1491 family protein [Acetobacter thailandicus]
MSAPRLRADIAAKAILREAGRDGQSAMLIHKGASEAGSLLVVLLERDGSAMILSQTRTTNGDPAWFFSSGEIPLTVEETGQYIDRQRRYDPDLWVLELEAPGFRLPFEATLV